MKYVLKAEQIRAAERAAKNAGLDEKLMRVNAALALADDIAERVKDRLSQTAVFCGTGGNGCDGLLAACRLHRMGGNVTAYTVGDANKTDVAVAAYAKAEGIKVLPAAEYRGGANIIVDAIFGIGLNKPITGAVAELIERLNAAENAFRIAVDIPSGLNADSGEIMGVAFRAHATVTFSCYKLGMLFGEGKNVCGRITVEDIGIKVASDIKVFDDEDFVPFARKATAHKGVSGKVYIIGGCGTMIGAPLMAGAAAHAAYLNGAGTVTVCLPSIHRAAAAARSTMAMMKFLPDDANGFVKFDKAALDGIASSAAAIDIGIGMGATPDLKRILQYLCAEYKGVLVIDADALNAIKGDYAFLRDAACKIVVTPHVGEFERMTGYAATTENAVKLAREIDGVVTLKSSTTIITDGREVRINVSGTPAMAKGGTGDVLGGCITALSCAFDVFDAATVACYRNGIGAEKAVSSYAEMMLTPRDVLKYADYDEL